GRSGTTHVLNPCEHVVCDRCFDGASFSACPVCERHVDRSSPFFLPTPERAAPKEPVRFKRIDLGDDPVVATKAFFVALCERKQPMSPNDRDALQVILLERKSQALAWLPAKIPVRENIAAVFGTLFRVLPADEVLPPAARYITTATDVLRFLIAASGID